MPMEATGGSVRTRGTLLLPVHVGRARLAPAPRITPWVLRLLVGIGDGIFVLPWAAASRRIRGRWERRRREQPVSPPVTCVPCDHNGASVCQPDYRSQGYWGGHQNRPGKSAGRVNVCNRVATYIGIGIRPIIKPVRVLAEESSDLGVVVTSSVVVQPRLRVPVAPVNAGPPTTALVASRLPQAS